MKDHELNELKAKISRDIEHECQALERERQTHELTPRDIIILQASVSLDIQSLGVRPVDYGRISAIITMIIGLEQIIADIERRKL